MDFRMVRKLVTLNDFERRNGRYFLRYSTKFGSVRWGGGNYVKVVEDRRKCCPQNLVFSDV